MTRIGIRREDKNEWERRAPLTPDHVAELIEEHDLQFSIQPSPIRVFPDRDYRAAGARCDDDLDGCRMILGIKEIPPAQLLRDRVYLFFSHTSKAQRHNLPLLRRLLKLGSTLIDYEHVRDAGGRRLIFFGRYAGHAGMIDALWALGRRLALEGFATPLERIRLAHEYSSLDEATNHVARVGEALRHAGVAERLRPLVFGFTGSGNVARGAQEIFDRLPHLELRAEGLEDLSRDRTQPGHLLYRAHFTRAQRVDRIGGGPFDLHEFERAPRLYRSAIPKWLPYLTVLVHGAWWEPRQPRLLSIRDLKQHWAAAGSRRLRLLADVSCDIGGGIEATVRATTPSSPVFVYDVDRDEAIDGVAGNGPVVLAIDNLPCQLPAESSEHFGDTLVRFLPLLVRCDWERPLDELRLPPEVAAAVVVHRGKLAPRHAHLARHLAGVETRP